MTRASRSISAQLRLAALIACAWLAFELLFGAISISIEGRAGGSPSLQLILNAMLVVPWTGFTFLIAAWHRRLRERDSSPFRIVLLHLPVVVLVALMDAAALREAIEMLTGMKLSLPFGATVVYYADFDIVRYVAVVAATDALLLRNQVMERQRLSDTMKRLLARARLDQLAAQMQPHFLFNALGAVSELAARAPQQAAKVVRQLSSIVKQSSNASSVEVPLSVEMAEIEPYLAIQRLRFIDWLSIHCEVSSDARDCIVPRFVLQPLVENAILHGLVGRTAAGSILIRAYIDEGVLIISVADNGVGLSPITSSSGHQIGLANIRERLAILYGDDDRLTLQNSDNGGAVAKLTLPVRHSLSVVHDDGADITGETSSLLKPSGAVTRSPTQRAVTLVGIWVACGLLWTQQSFLYEAMRGRLGNDSWLAIGTRDMLNALIWAALTPFVLEAAKRFPIGRRRLTLRMVAYLFGAAGVALLHAALLERLTNPQTPLWSPAYEMTLTVDFLVVVVLVGVAHRRQFLEWLVARDANAAELQSALDLARHSAKGLQSISPVLLRFLDSLALRLESSADDCEDVIAYLGDYLRIAIESSGVDSVSAEQKASLAVAESNVEMLMRSPSNALSLA